MMMMKGVRVVYALHLMPSTDNSLESRSTRSRSSGGTRSVRGIVDPANSVPGGKGKGKANPRSTPRTASGKRKRYGSVVIVTSLLSSHVISTLLQLATSTTVDSHPCDIVYIVKPKVKLINVNYQCT